MPGPSPSPGSPWSDEGSRGGPRLMMVPAHSRAGSPGVRLTQSDLKVTPAWGDLRSLRTIRSHAELRGAFAHKSPTVQPCACLASCLSAACSIQGRFTDMCCTSLRTRYVLTRSRQRSHDLRNGRWYNNDGQHVIQCFRFATFGRNHPEILNRCNNNGGYSRFFGQHSPDWHLRLSSHGVGV